MSTETPTTPAQAVADTDAELGRLEAIVAKLSDGDLHRAHFDGGWTVAECISHINVCNVMWLGDLQRLADDPELSFFFREEIGHDLVGYPPPTVEIAVRQLQSTRRSLTTCLPPADPGINARTVEIPDLGTMTIEEWTPLIAGHLAHHVGQAIDIMKNREFLPAQDA